MIILQKRMLFFRISIVALVCLLSCKENFNPAQAHQQLLQSNEIQRQAHLENNADLLVSEIADTMISIQNGEIHTSSNAEIKNRFENYFSQVRYTSWDDMQAPLIQVSEDGSMASVSVQKFIDIQGLDSTGGYGEHGYVQFAWNAQYKNINAQWKLYQNTSTRKVLTAEAAVRLPIHFSKVYAVIDEKDLIPEGVAYDQSTNITYLSSTYKQKIVAIHPDGSYVDFKHSREDGLWSTVGMEVDENHQKLWVISSNAHEVLPMQFPDSSTEWTSKIYEYQLPGGDLLNIYQADIEGRYFFNDICIAQSGEVYISESMQNKVWLLEPGKGLFSELPIRDSLFAFPNGITISEDDRYLYISGGGGIAQYDLKTTTFKYLEKHDGIINNGIDGLAYYKGTLIANQPYRNRILQFMLDEEGSIIKHQKILEANNTFFDQPSTGEIAGNHFVYLANAQMRSGFENRHLKQVDSLEAVVMLKVGLE